MDLSDLVGEQILNRAAVMSEVNSEADEKVNAISFALDHKTYTLLEDPDDGYRSYIGEIIVEEGISDKLKNASVINRFVVITHEDVDSNVIVITDKSTGHVWLVLGTENTDDYYPYCLMQWNPMPPSES